MTALGNTFIFGIFTDDDLVRAKYEFVNFFTICNAIFKRDDIFQK